MGPPVTQRMRVDMKEKEVFLGVKQIRVLVLEVLLRNSKLVGWGSRFSLGLTRFLLG